MTTTTYERLDEHEVESVRALRRQMWRTRAEDDPMIAGKEARKAIGSFVDEWADGLYVDEVVAACLVGVQVGHLPHEKRYALITLIAEDAACTH